MNTKNYSATLIIALLSSLCNTIHCMKDTVMQDVASLSLAPSNPQRDNFSSDSDEDSDEKYRLQELTNATLAALDLPATPLGTKKRTQPATIDHLLLHQISDNNVLTLDAVAIEKGIDGVCTWPQLFQLTYLLCKATFATSLHININKEPVTYLPKNQTTQKLWTMYDEQIRWNTALLHATEILQNTKTDDPKLPTIVACNLYTPIAFFESFAPLTDYPYDDLDTSNPRIATHYVELCFKHLHNLVQLTQAFPASQTNVDQRRNNALCALGQLDPKESIINAYRNVTTTKPLNNGMIPNNDCVAL